METKPKDQRPDVGETVEHLKKALDECREHLAHANEMLRKATSQDNDPRALPPPYTETPS